jgi:cyclopropane fatty-acyl-phospholipid synthase-like methyltransferase
LPARVPAYFDLLIAGFKAGHTGRHVHLGYWHAPPALTTPCSAEEFEAAQARLADVVIDLADLADGQSVLDVGCGFGGTLAAINARWRQMRLCGLNIDPRQLEICGALQPQPTNALTWLQADACALPLRESTFDRVICLEAMFHFRAREVFLAQAAAVLVRGGRLILSDILLRHPGTRAPTDVTALEAIMRRDYGPWPELWIGLDEVTEYARRAGFTLDRIIDGTAQTLPSYRVTAPHPEMPPRSAGSLTRWLHREGYLTYVCLAFTRV